MQEVNEAWERLKMLSVQRQSKLAGAHEIHSFYRWVSVLANCCKWHPCFEYWSPVVVYRDADETKNWINEKDKVLSSDDYGKDLASVNALQRKHEAMERDLAALEDKVGLVVPHWQYLLLVYFCTVAILCCPIHLHYCKTIIIHLLFSPVSLPPPRWHMDHKSDSFYEPLC